MTAPYTVTAHAGPDAPNPGEVLVEHYWTLGETLRAQRELVALGCHPVTAEGPGIVFIEAA